MATTPGGTEVVGSWMSISSWPSIRSFGSGTSSAETGEQARVQRAPGQAPSAQQLVGAILVVDDDPEIRDVVRWLLEDEGWTVETASDGRDALERATQVRPALIVLDMGLPILSGEE